MPISTCAQKAMRQCHSPQILDVPDSQEVSRGYFIPLNNNFDEGNKDGNGNPVSDNVADSIVGQRVTITDSRETSDRQITAIFLDRYGAYTVSGSTATFEFSPKIRLWGRGPSYNNFFQIQSGVAYNVSQFYSTTYASIFIEGVEESQSLNDVELKATVALSGYPLQVDTLRLTVGNLRAEVDAEATEISAHIPIAPYTNQHDGEFATVNLRRNGTIVETQQVVIGNGEVNAAFATQPIFGRDYSVETFFLGQRGTSNAPPYEVNLTIDSNNDGFIHADDDAVEDIVGQPGKWIPLNLYDSDGDRIPNYVDGYQWQHGGDFAVSQNSAGLYPIKLAVGELAKSPNAKVRFTYNANNPLLGVQQYEVPAATAQGYSVAGYKITDQGHLRIWTTGQFRIGTSPNWQSAPGNWLPSGEDFNLSQLGTSVNGVYTLWVEAVLPSQTKGDLSIVVTVDAYGDGSLVLTDRVNVTAVGTKGGWQNQALNRAMLNPKGWKPDQGVTEQVPNMRKVYEYYKRTFLQDSNHLLWAGLARRAGFPVLNGMNILEAAIAQNSGPTGSATLLIAAHSLGTSMLKMNKAVFDDIAWQHEAYLTGGVATLELLAQYSNSQDINLTNLAIWQAIAIGNPESIQAGNRDLLQREQLFVLQPHWNQVSFPTGIILGWMAESPLPSGRTFTAFYGSTIPLESIADYNKRWTWLQDDMVPKWIAMTDAERRALATVPLPST